MTARLYASTGHGGPLVTPVPNSAPITSSIVTSFVKGCARGYIGVVEGANLIKLGRDEPKISYLCYPDFETEHRWMSGHEPAVDPALVEIIAKAHAWVDRIARGEAEGPGDIAAQDRLARTDVSRALGLAFLAPDIIRTILHGRQPTDLTSNMLLRMAPRLPADWQGQRRMLRFPPAWLGIRSQPARQL